MRQAPPYVPGHQLLAGKSILITAAAGAGIGYAAAKRCAEEGCRALMISDIHPRRLEEAVERLKAETGLQAVYGSFAMSPSKPMYKRWSPQLKKPWAGSMC